MAGGDDALADECAQAGRSGLWKAIRKFDPARSIPFDGFAAPYVRWEMLDVLRATERFQKRHVLFSDLEAAEGEDERDDMSDEERAVAASIYSDAYLLDGVTEIPDLDEVAVRFVAALPPRLQLVAQRVLLDGASQRAVAAELGVSPMAVTKYMRTIRTRGRAALATFHAWARAA